MEQMRAGPLRHRIDLQVPGGTRDAVGQRTTTWTDVATDVPARVRSLSGREQIIAAQSHASTTHMVDIRWSPNVAAIDASCRIKFGERYFKLDKPPENVDERNQWLLLSCVEGLSDE